jgi:hypothetical protein
MGEKDVNYAMTTQLAKDLCYKTLLIFNTQ